MPAYKRSDRKLKPWCYRFWENKTPYRQCGFRTRKEALAAEADARRQLNRLMIGITFGEAASRRLDYLQAYTTREHCRGNRTMLRRFSAWLDLLLQEISPQMVRDRLMELAQALGNHNANRHLRALRSVFELAVHDGDLPRNPCRGLKAFPVSRAVKFVPTTDQLAYLELILDTGARVREINFLAWDDVDWQQDDKHPQGQVRLWTRKKQGGHRTPRWVPLSARGHQALQYAYNHRDAKSPHVFTNPRTGKPYDYRDKFFDTLCRRAGVPECGYHSLRHFYASQMADQRVPLDIIQNRLGHQNISTTSGYLRGLGRRE